MYTNRKDLIKAFNDGNKIFFGFDLLIPYSDVLGRTDYEKYKTDIMICIFTKTEIDCHDSYYNKSNDNDPGIYYINSDRSFSNSMIPFGFIDVELNCIQENVIDFDNYFSVNFKKEYPPDFDKVTMFNWINYVASDTDHKIIAFYGILENDIQDGIKDNECLYREEQDFIDGQGLNTDFCLIVKNKYLAFNFLFLFLLIFNL